jgi:hypothetical protein
MLAQKKRSDEPEPLQQAQPRALKEQHLAAAPFGAWQVLLLSKHRGLFAHVWLVCWKQEPMLTHGRVVTGPGLARSLLWFQSPLSKRKHGIGTVPTHVTGDAIRPKNGRPARQQLSGTDTDLAMVDASAGSPARTPAQYVPSPLPARRAEFADFDARQDPART